MFSVCAGYENRNNRNRIFVIGLAIPICSRHDNYGRMRALSLECKHMLIGALAEMTDAVVHLGRTILKLCFTGFRRVLNVGLKCV